MKKEVILLGILLLASISIINADPLQDSIHVNINVQDSNNKSLVGIYNFQLSISNDSSCSNLISNYVFNNINTDPQANVNFYLENTNMTYNIQYYLKEVIDNVLISCFKIAYSKNHAPNNLSQLNNDMNFTNFNNNTDTVNNSNHLNGLNSTQVANLFTSPYLYNMTIETYNLYNAVWTSSFNYTYDTWLSNYTLYSVFWYNMTTPAIDYVNGYCYSKNDVYNKIESNNNFCYANGTNSSGVNCQTISSTDTWTGNQSNYYNISQVNSNLSLRYLASNPLNFINVSNINGTNINVLTINSTNINANGNINSVSNAYSFSSFPTTADRGDDLTLGFSFKVTSPITISQLGRLYVVGNNQNHVIKLWISTNTATPLASGTILYASASDSNNFKWVTVTPITLTPGNTYVIGVDEYGTDVWKDDWSPSMQSVFTNVAGRYGTVAGNYPASVSGTMYDTGAMYYAIGSGDMMSNNSYSTNSYCSNSYSTNSSIINLNVSNSALIGGAPNGYAGLSVMGGSNFVDSIPPYGVASIGKIDASITGVGSWRGSGFLFTNADTGNKAFSLVYNNDQAFFGGLNATSIANWLVVGATGITTVNVSASYVKSTNGFSVGSNDGITKNIKVVTTTYPLGCWLNITGGIITSSTC